MKIWIDLTNSPHVNFFAGMIKELRHNHEILLTCRPLANTIDLLEFHDFSFHVVGKHYGQNLTKKVSGFPVRIWQLWQFLKDKRIDVAISHSSFYSPLVSRLLGVRCLYLNDNEHAAGNRISFAFAHHIMIPEFLDIKKVKKQGAKTNKTTQYPGVKEGVYLWNYQPGDGRNNPVSTASGKDVIFIRPEPWTAQYYKGKKNFIDDILINLRNQFTLVLLPRGRVQEEYYRHKKFAGIIVSKESIGLSDIMENCALFIGAGGTMTREAAVLGVPTISIYQDQLLYVDRFLIDSGAMIHKKNLTATDVLNFLKTTRKKQADKQLLAKGKQAYELIKQALLVP